MERVISIYEVSQKQAYIFSSNKLRDNVHNSEIIAYITGSPYIEKAVGDPKLYNTEDNLVYAGGGHTILEFPSMEQAKEAARRVTAQILRDYPGIEMFVKSIPYDEKKTPNENVMELTAELEKKKSVRRASFHQGSFGIEGKMTGHKDPENPERTEWVPEGYTATTQLENLGGSEANFVAVVHIDGNAMGKRVETIAEASDMRDWASYKKKMYAFSTAISADFKAAYEEMEKAVAQAMLNGTFAEKLSLKQEQGTFAFPLRRIISEGDDICFVANGQIGIECAAEFIKALTKKENPVDHQKYAACAGVALVHQKYPFYRAYELAEELCSNAKRYGAGLSKDGTGSEISCIDWHIEYGELQDTLEETRKQYITDDGKQLEVRPYMIEAPQELIQKDPVRQYENFRKLIRLMNKSGEFYGRGLLKGLRPVLKEGETAADYYLHFHKADDIRRDAYQDVYTEVDYAGVKIGGGSKMDRPIFVRTADGRERSTLFDAIEVMDSYLLLGEEF